MQSRRISCKYVSYYLAISGLGTQYVLGKGCVVCARNRMSLGGNVLNIVAY